MTKPLPSKPHALVMREPADFLARVEAQAFWWTFSSERRALLVSQQMRRLARSVLSDTSVSRRERVK